MTPRSHCLIAPWHRILFLVLCQAMVLPSFVTIGLAQTVTTHVTSSGLGTTINDAGTTQNIRGGTLSTSNLFHSFGELSIGTGDSAVFQNLNGAGTAPMVANGATVSNIVGRVTGDNPSSIFGTIDSTTGFPNASLFLINPHGIVFGPTASLNVGGSVHFSTADYLRLGTGSEVFYADLGKTSTLSSSAVTAFGFLGTSPASITIQSSSFQVQPGLSLSLVGGDITIEGRNGSVPQAPALPTVMSPGGVINTVYAPDGVLNLISVKSGEVNVQQVTSNRSVLDVTSVNPENLGAITLKQYATVGVDGEGKGLVVIRAGKLSIEDSRILARTFGSGVNGGDPSAGINIKVSELVLSQNASPVQPSEIQTSSVNFSGGAATGNANPITIQANTITMNNDSRILGDTTSFGHAGSISIKPLVGALDLRLNDNASISSSSEDSTATGTAGNAGNIDITASSIRLTGRNQIRSFTNNLGDGGNISLAATNDITVKGTGPSAILTSTVAGGNAGSIQIKADSLVLDGTGNGFGGGGGLEIAGTTGIASNSEGHSISGNAGSITVDATNISVVGGAEIASKSIGSFGHGGSINITATDSLTLSGTRLLLSNAEIRPSSISTATRAEGSSPAQGPGGDITIYAGTFSINKGAMVSATTSGPGGAGTIAITTPVLNMSLGQIATGTTDTGKAGAITLNLGQLIATDSAQVSSNSTFAGPTAGTAGTVTIQGIGGTGTLASSIRLNNAILSTEAAGGAGGAISMLTSGPMSLTHATVSSTISGGTDPARDPANVTIESGAFNMTGGSISAETGGTATGGTITATGSNFSMSNGAKISTSSTGADPLTSGAAGSIGLTSTTDLTIDNSTVTTQAAQASGGNIKLTAPGTILLDHAKITSSVNGPAGSNGGNISIDPQFVILRNGSQILAQAIGGNGGGINIRAGTFLAEPNTLINASSLLGVSGRITIQSPTQSLSGAIAPLPQNLVNLASIYGQHCAAQKGGQFSSLVQGERDGLPAQPGDLLSSPLSPELIRRDLRSEDPAPISPATARLALIDPINFVRNATGLASSGCRS